MINRFISLNTCVFNSDRSHDLIELNATRKLYIDAGVKNEGGSNIWDNLTKMHEAHSISHPDLIQEMTEEAEASNGTGRHALKNEHYNDQLWMMRAFQEPIPFEDWEKGTMTSNRYDLNVDLVPITYWVSEDDSVCPMLENRLLFNYTNSPGSTWNVVPYAEHDYFNRIDGDTFLSQMVAAIETGDPTLKDDYPSSLLSAQENCLFDGVSDGLITFDQIDEG